jgi:hypothetical protein
LLVLRAFFLAGFFFFTSSLDLILHPLHLEPGFFSHGHPVLSLFSIHLYKCFMTQIANISTKHEP